MSLNDMKLAKPRTLIPEDVHLAKLYSVVSLGEHASGTYKNTDGSPKTSQQIAFTFEFQDVRLDDGRPAAQTITVTASTGTKSRLRPVLLALLGGGKQAEEQLKDENKTLGEVLQSVLGKAVMLGIKHTEDGKYANVESSSPVPSSMRAMIKPVENKLVFVADPNSMDEETVQLLPEFLKTKISQRLDNPKIQKAGNVF